MGFVIHKSAESELHHRLIGVVIELIVQCDSMGVFHLQERVLHDTSEQQDIELLGRLVWPEHHGKLRTLFLVDCVNEPLSLVSVLVCLSLQTYGIAFIIILSWYFYVSTIFLVICHCLQYGWLNIHS